jgi:hypothetical protein
VTIDATVVDVASLEEALGLIDKALPSLTHREVVSTDEMTDLLLDIRSSLTETGV